MTWSLSVSATKLSLLIVYVKLFSSLRWLIWAARVAALAIVLWLIGTMLGIILLCQPFVFNWDKTVTGGHCAAQGPLLKAVGALDVFTDVLVLVLPMRPLARLQMARWKRLSLLLAFGLGFV